MSENGCRESEHVNNLEVANQAIFRNPIMIQGPKRTFSVINKSLVGLDGSDPNFSDNDVLMELGRLNISEMTEDYPLPQKILIKDVVIMCHTGPGVTLNCYLAVSSTTGTAPNTAIQTPVELVGAGATYIGEALETVGSEADFNLNSIGITSVCPNIVISDILTSYVYLVQGASSPLDQIVMGGGSFSLFIDYYVL